MSWGGVEMRAARWGWGEQGLCYASWKSRCFLYVSVVCRSLAPVHSVRCHSLRHSVIEGIVDGTVLVYFFLY